MGAHASCAGRTMNSRKLSMEYAAAGFTELRLSDEGNGVLSRPGRTEAGRFTPGGLMALFLALSLAVAFFGASPAKAEEEFLSSEESCLGKDCFSTFCFRWASLTIKKKQ